MSLNIKSPYQAQVKNGENILFLHVKYFAACQNYPRRDTLLIICSKMGHFIVDNSVKTYTALSLPSSLVRLMSRGKIPWKATVKPEERISIEFADALRGYTLTGELSAVWHHNPNEGKRHPITGIIMRAMGMLPGVADYTFTWLGGSGHIELKTGKNTQSDYQKDYEQWCAAQGVHYEICRTPTEGFDVLKNWGVLDKSTTYKDLT